MRVLVCGSRHFNDYEKLKQWLDWYILPNNEKHTIIEGEARGADLLARKYAEGRGMDVLPFPAEWDKYGKAAGPIRNSQMLKEGKPELVIAFLGPVAVSEFTSGLSDSKYSSGTKNMIDQARKAGVETVVVDV